MLPLIAAGLTAGAGLYGLHRQNATARAMAREQMGFQSQMSGTSYQRVIADMRAAGINPILAYQQGGASTPTGAMAPVTDEVSPAVSTAMQQRRLHAEIDNLEALNKNLKQQDKKLEAETALSYALQGSTKMDTLNKMSSAKKLEKQIEILEGDVPEAKLKGSYDSSTYGKFLYHLDRIGNTLGQFNPFSKINVNKTQKNKQKGKKNDRKIK